MTHEAVQDLLLDLAYGELSAREARKVEAHAASCDACRARLETIRDTRRSMSALRDEPAPERGENVLLAAARERASGRQRARGLPRWLFAASVAAVSAVTVVAVSYRVMEMRPGPLGGSDTDLLGEARPGTGAAAAPKGTAAGAATARASPGDVASEVAPSRDAEKEASGASALRRRSPAENDRLAAQRAERPAKRAAPAPEEKWKREAPSEPSRFAERPALAYEASPPAYEAPPQAPPPAGAKAAAPPRPSAGAAGPAPSRPAPRGEAYGAFADGEAPAAPRSRSAPGMAAAPAQRAEAPQRSDARASAPAPPDAVRRYEALRAEGRLSGEIRTFPGCAGEEWRKVERDPAGRVVAYVREGTIGGARFRAEAIYGEDGRLARARALPLGGGPVPAAATLVPREAALAEIDQPPRCEP